MRSLLSISLIVLVFLNLFGFYILFIGEQTEIGMEMNESIARDRSDNRVALQLTEKDFSGLVWNNNGREFNLNGRMYDVVKVEHAGSVVKITVEYDTRETSLVSNFISLFHQQSDSEKQSSSNKTKLHNQQQDYVNNAGCSFTSLNANSTLLYLTEQNFHLITFVPSIPLPPPWFLIA